MDERKLERRFDEMREKIALQGQGVYRVLMVAPLIVSLIGMLLKIARPDSVVIRYAFGALIPSLTVMSFVYYARRREQVKRRLHSIADRAVPVDCTVGEIHVFEIAHGAYASGRKYFPAVEFEYERDGTTHWSVYPYPDGISRGSNDLQEAERLARELASQADGTAYYDPATEQAFLVDEPETRAVNQWIGDLALMWFIAGALTVFVLL
jgi:hypothetical protein